jgi:endogenous inhibitor of DNA gyrase (YacG/DUF329 family)
MTVKPKQYVQLVCNECGSSFQAWAAKKNRQLFCSDKCRNRDFVKKHPANKITIPDDPVGFNFGRLTIISVNRDHKSRIWYKCSCSCGKETKVQRGVLMSGRQVSCGCYIRELLTNNTLESGQNHWFKYLRGQAKARNIMFDLTIEQAIEIGSMNCKYCGAQPTDYTAAFKASSRNNCFNKIFKINGLDRIDPKGGYTKDNVNPCCLRCNTAKWTMGLEEFKQWVICVYNNFARGDK